MNKLELFSCFAGNASRVVRVGAVAMALYVLAKSIFVSLKLFSAYEE
jgi:hypothetical protein